MVKTIARAKRTIEFFICAMLKKTGSSRCRRYDYGKNEANALITIEIERFDLVHLVTFHVTDFTFLQTRT